MGTLYPSLVHIETFADPAAFLAAASAFLVGEEAVHCILLGVPGDMVRFGGNPEARFWVMTDDRQQVVGAALWTPPLSLAVSRMSRDGADALAAELFEQHLPLPGVRGPAEETRWFAEAWARLSGAHVEAVDGGEHAWQLSRGAAPAEPTRAGEHGPVTGHCEVATGRDLAALQQWAAEASMAFGQPQEYWSQNIELAVRERQLYVWHDPAPVAMAMLRGETPHGVRVSGVFTPSESQRKGYATALVREMSATALQAERDFCFLFTDARNATAEGIYARLGYEQVATCQQYRFLDQTGAG